MLLYIVRSMSEFGDKQPHFAAKLGEMVMKKHLVVLFVVVLLSGCASVGPYLADPRVFQAESKKAVAARDADIAYYQAEEKSFEGGGSGIVARKGEARVRPGLYHDGYLVNLNPQYAVSFLVSGPVNVAASVRAALKPEDARNKSLPILYPARLLASASYRIEVRKEGAEYPYSTNNSWYINNTRGDATVFGVLEEDVNRVMELTDALAAGGLTPAQQKKIQAELERLCNHVCDFSAYAP